jgi:hypothetical protein
MDIPYTKTLDEYLMHFFVFCLYIEDVVIGGGGAFRQTIRCMWHLSDAQITYLIDFFNYLTLISDIETLHVKVQGCWGLLGGGVGRSVSRKAEVPDPPGKC